MEVDSETAIYAASAIITTPMAVGVLRTMVPPRRCKEAGESWGDYYVRIWFCPANTVTVATIAWIAALGGTPQDFEISVVAAVAGVVWATLIWRVAVVHYWRKLAPKLDQRSG